MLKVLGSRVYLVFVEAHCRIRVGQRLRKSTVNFYDAVESYRPVKVTFTRPSLRSFAPVMAAAATSQRTAAVPAMAPDAARLCLAKVDTRVS